MKTTLFTLFLLVLLASACNSGAQTGKPQGDTGAATVSADTTAKAADAAKNSTDSLVNAAPDTIKAK